MNFIAVNEMNLNLIDWIEINDCCNGSIYCYYKIHSSFISVKLWAEIELLMNWIKLAWLWVIRMRISWNEVKPNFIYIQFSFLHSATPFHFLLRLFSLIYSGLSCFAFCN